MRAPAVLVTLALVVSACKKNDTDTDGVDPVDTDVQQADFGYDTRPSNPTCIAPSERLVEAASIDVARRYQSVALNEPVGLYMAPGDPDHWYVIEQAGRVKRFDANAASPTAEVVLDITGPVSSGGETGLLGLAFDPDFQTNGLVFLSYTSTGPVSHLSSVQTSDNGATWDAGSLTSILSVNQPFSNHNGGHIQFGLDGMLYMSLGDGGSGGDPGNRAQDLSTVLGKILRLDVAQDAYTIPADNPFVGVPDAREEIFAYGLRNVWRFGIDRVTGEIWAGDVGQNAIEEVDLVQSGGNYGWRIKEGRSCYATSPCEGGGLIDPVVQYLQDSAYGGRSVVGGPVYRGSAIPELVGTPIFSDYYHGKITAITYNPATGAGNRTVLLDSGRTIVHFAEDAAGELYFLDHDNGGIYAIEPLGTPVQSDFPMTLSETGCVNAANPRQMADGVIPYTLNHPFWSDGAEKKRWLAIPDGTTLTVAEDGDFEFPVGTVLIKEFTVNGHLTETRLFMRHTDEWAGYTYRWREDGSDADLVRSSEVVDADGVDWEIPSRPQCMQCHTEAAGRSLGVEVGQLAGLSQVYPTNLEAPQLATLAHIGLIASEPVDPAAFPAVGDQAAPVDARARTYLHVNCSQCHRPDGPGGGDLDMRLETSLANTGLCGVPNHGDFNGQATNIVTPGDPGSSVLSLRIRDLGAYRMPPLASHVVDEVGAGVIDAWITGLTSCP